MLCCAHQQKAHVGAVDRCDQQNVGCLKPTIIIALVSTEHNIYCALASSPGILIGGRGTAQWIPDLPSPCYSDFE